MAEVLSVAQDTTAAVQERSSDVGVFVYHRDAGDY